MGPPGPGPLGPPSVLPPVGSRPSILPSIVPGQAGPIIPRLPNGIPLTDDLITVIFVLARDHVHLDVGVTTEAVAEADLVFKGIAMDEVEELLEGEEISVECAKAVGIDNDYLSKLEDQRRKRDEVLRRKEQRRFGEAETALKKNKAYLCVNVKNIKQLTTAKMRVETLAKDLGEIRKCWKSNEDQVTVIFVEHAKAKEFMLKYNNKVLSGLRIQVSLEKAYLNLSEIQ
ncbi:hypothetical protein TELCIR_15884 [Teladorsagia circumcincta]|uniref:Uncharacterized protein n=1 Tax=Teladorsagia circumcincta TaxID=45464 RepID=A0A2G9TX53_TELCI|nr:hypothetical protein TELCIR_15884 [Teladorsagia circumcincta]